MQGLFSVLAHLAMLVESKLTKSNSIKVSEHSSIEVAHCVLSLCDKMQIVYCNYVYIKQYTVTIQVVLRVRPYIVKEKPDFKFNAYSITRWGQPEPGILDLATRAISCFQSPTPSRARFRVAIQRDAAGDA